MHPFFDNDTLDYDVGLVNVPEGMELDGVTMTTVKLASSGAVPETGKYMMVAGWGLPYEDSPLRNQYLIGVKVPVISHEDCKRLQPRMPPKDFCAGYPEGGKDACQGDSGSPAVLIETGVQVGLVSANIGCARKSTPGLYTKVFDPEIRSFIKKHSNV